MRKEQADVKILRLSSVADVETLTSHQRDLVEMTLEEGSLDYPRRITLRDLAKGNLRIDSVRGSPAR